MSNHPLTQSEIILYQTNDGRTRLQVRLQDETVWLTQKLMAELFQTSVPNVSMHIRNVFAVGELQADSVAKEFLTTAADGKSYATLHYNLDVIISAEAEYARYRAALDAQPRAVDAEFEKTAKQIQKLPSPKRVTRPKS